MLAIIDGFYLHVSSEQSVQFLHLQSKANVSCQHFVLLGLSLIVFFFSPSIFVTLHHEMSRNVPDGHFHVFIFSAIKFYAVYNGENHFQIRGIVVELHAFEYGGTTVGTFGKKTCFNC